MNKDYEKICTENRIPGHFHSGCFNALVEIANKLPDSGTLINIGTFLGRSTKFWADILRYQNKVYRIIALDVFENDSTDVFHEYLSRGYAGDILYVKDFLHKHKDNISMVKDIFKEYKEVEIYKYDVLLDIPKESWTDDLVCVFDDSLHTEEAVNKSFKDWFPMIKPGGIYCGHDYSTIVPEVITQVNRISKKTGIKINIPRKDSSVYYFEKCV